MKFIKFKKIFLISSFFFTVIFSFSSCSNVAWVAKNACRLCEKSKEKTPVPQPTKTPTPSVTKTATPKPSKTPTPAIQSGKFIEGHIKFLVNGLENLPWSLEDDFIIGVMEWEPHSCSSPLLGIHIRGTSKENAGVLVKWGSKRCYDREVNKKHGDTRPDLYSGAAMNYHHRIKPVANGIWGLEWNQVGYRLDLPNGKFLEAEWKNAGGVSVYNTMGFSGLRTELRALGKEVYLVWNKFQATKHGVSVSVTELKGTPGNLQEFKPGN